MNTLENDITEAIFAAEDALQHLYQAKTFLKKARNWGIFDIVAGGFITSIIKHKHIENAQEEIRYAKTALENADVVILAEIYAAREVNTTGVSAEDISKLMDQSKVTSFYLPTFEEIEDYLRSHLEEGDLCITMGAGNVTDIGPKLVQQ